VPWLDLLKRVGDRKAAVKAALAAQKAAGLILDSGAGAPNKRVKKTPLTIEELESIRKNLVIEKADPEALLEKTAGKKKRKQTSDESLPAEKKKKA
jgi:hypothetical protein